MGDEGAMKNADPPGLFLPDLEAALRTTLRPYLIGADIDEEDSAVASLQADVLAAVLPALKYSRVRVAELEKDMERLRGYALSIDACGAALRTLLNVLQLSNTDLDAMYGRTITLDQAATEARACVQAWEERR